jgi:hypothetical protein
MTIGKKISITCGFLVLLTLVLGVVALMNVSSMDERMSVVAFHSLPGVKFTGDLMSLQHQIHITVLNHINSSDAKQMAEMEAKLADFDKDFRTKLKDYESTITLPEDRELWKKIGPAYEAIWAGWFKVRVPSRRSQNELALSIFHKDMEPFLAPLTKTINDLRALKENRGTDFANQGAAAAAAGAVLDLGDPAGVGGGGRPAGDADYPRDDGGSQGSGDAVESGRRTGGVGGGTDCGVGAGDGAGHVRTSRVA